ncbi:hypothetical protein LT493_11685 [Streptomyces tricolor]|nr:hypothetical protein [Streptomyces tricolor]
MLLGAGTDTITDDYTLEQKFAEFRRLHLDFVEVPCAAPTPPPRLRRSARWLRRTDSPSPPP